MSKLKYASLTFVSGNAGKHAEYCDLLGISDLKRSEITITEMQDLSLRSLVIQKIDAIRPKLLDTPFFVEHTALVIDAWKGLPGGLIDIFMKTVDNDGICKMMQAYKNEERSARAEVVIGYYDKESGVQIFRGRVIGEIARKPKGKNNFGWDPIFIPKGFDKTYAEMTLEEKNQTSMRRRAVEELIDFLLPRYEL